MLTHFDGLTVALALLALALAFFAQYAARRHLRESEPAQPPVSVTVYDELFRTSPLSPVSRARARDDMKMVA